MVIGIAQATINLGVAVAVGAAIGFERQWRQRLAGLRTNTLVALGAASFVVFESLFSTDTSPTRIAAQVVSGIGFLGAGIIFREGLNVRGLNTAATLWCSAGRQRGPCAGVAAARTQHRRPAPAPPRQLQYRGLRSRGSACRSFRR
jgi:putative Mg2+ transporter-C (MgtC) family protein